MDGCANAVFFRGSSSGISDPRTESYPGDGVRQQFRVLYRCHSEVSVKVNNVTKTVGIKGIDSGKDWYWKDNDDIIEQDESGTVLGVGDTIAVTYRGIVSTNIQIEDSDDIAARALAEGTSGRYEALYDDSSVQDMGMALDKAEMLLRQSMFDKVDVVYETDVPGLRAGMIQTIQLTEEEVDATVLITSVRGQELNSDGYPFRYTVSGVSGEKREDWLDFYRKLAKTKTYELRDNEVVNKSIRLKETCVLSHAIGVITRPQWIWGTSTWNGGDAWW
jgi:hypothetical protein